MPRPSVPAPKTHQRRVSIPGLLTELVQRRCAEFRYPAFSPFCLELVCFDLRLRVPHEITLRFARETPSIQAAIDREFYRQFREGGERNGILVQAVQGRVDPPAAAAPPGEFARHRDRLRYSDSLAPCIEVRWREAGYESFSDYVTALIRYDLLLLGPHNYFSGDDTDPEILASLDRGTVREFHENRQPKRIYLDYLLEKIAGRSLTQEELSARKRELAEQIIQRALAADAEERSRARRRNPPSPGI
jgi:hypothetical protein